jgi:pyruvate/2-oxoglutarate dehydrogenase complex dihydrolipoamide dehydrogenase (E3) component
MKYDAIAIGFGQGASSLVNQLANEGWKIALIEKNEESSYGGSCINIGCIPTKILEYDSKHGKNYIDAVKRRQEVVERNSQAEKESMEDNEQVDLYTGIGSFIDDYRVKVETADESYELEADHIIIDTGSEPIIPPIEGLDEVENVYTSTSLQKQEELPENLGIIGGGNIGLEYASIYQGFGSNVTLIESNDTILAGEEPEVAAEVEQVLKDKGINVQVGVDVNKVENNEDGLLLTMSDNSEISVDALLIATGRKPHIKSLNLENTGIELTEKEGIQTDNHLQTTVENVFALGDARGEEQFTYITTKDAEIVYNYLFEDGDRFLQDRKNVPYAIFMDPPFARVGLTEEEAEEKGYTVVTNTAPVSGTTRSDVIDDKRGLYKAVVNKRTNQILGVTLFGDQAHELVNFVKLAMDNELLYTVLKNQMFTHPVMSEIFNTLFDIK